MCGRAVGGVALYGTGNEGIVAVIAQHPPGAAGPVGLAGDPVTGIIRITDRMPRSIDAGSRTPEAVVDKACRLRGIQTAIAVEITLTGNGRDVLAIFWITQVK